jgi:hypothetical protein
VPYTQAGKDAKLNLNRGGSVIATWFLALTSTEPGQSGIMTGELSGGGYARVSVANNDTTWGPPTLGSGSNNRRSIFNLIEIVFPVSTGAQGTAAFVVGMTASTAGVAHWYQAIGPYLITNSNYLVRFPIGQLDLSEEDP